jgi:hypothetical protein
MGDFLLPGRREYATLIGSHINWLEELCYGFQGSELSSLQKTSSLA